MIEVQGDATLYYAGKLSLVMQLQIDEQTSGLGMQLKQDTTNKSYT